MPGAEEARDGSTAQVVPYAEDGSGDGGHRIGGEMERGQRGGQAGILHAHFDGYGTALGC